MKPCPATSSPTNGHAHTCTGAHAKEMHFCNVCRRWWWTT
jgi:hypothetical protein